MILILDIDDTLADTSHREHYVAIPGKEDWDSFFSPNEIYKDKGFDEANKFLREYISVFDKVYIITGRPHRIAFETEEWLIENYDLFYFGNVVDMFTRPDDIHLSSVDYKMTVFEEFILPENRNEEFVFIDDQQKILDAFKKYGIVLKAPDCWALLNEA